MLKKVNSMIVGTINLNIFRCVSPDITTDEVIITDRQLVHIKERHLQDYEQYSKYIPEILLQPDFIIEANRPNSAVLLKEIVCEGENVQLIIRFKTSSDSAEYKNSIITFMKIRKKEWNRLLKNKKILYSAI
jgi:predicted dinucleotide-utilizing enzyme